MIQIEVTLRCPFNCSQCYKKNIENKDMDFEYLNNLINLIIKKKVKLVTLNGGEPLLYPDIVYALEKLGKSGIKTNIFSSGVGLNDKIINLLSDYKNIYYFISLNGSNKRINDKSREGYEVSMGAIKKLYNEGVIFGINWVARHDNVLDFPNILKLCSKYNISFLSVTGNKLTGNNIIESEVTKKDIERLAFFINNRKQKDTAILIESCFSILTTLIDGNKNGFAAHCYAGISNCTVNCDKTFQPCTHLKVKEEYNDLETYWNSSPYLKKLRLYPPTILEPCNTCRNSKICSLCRAMSLETYNDAKKGRSSCIGYL